jgi:peptidoglycan/xylan/chitin deacetylase (PgdA/CDA1 family)
MSRYAVTNIVFIVLIAGSIALNTTLQLPVLWYLFLVLAYALITTYGTLYISAQFFMPARTKSIRSSNEIALTFDDGPIPGKTARLLEILKAHNVPAAFFCIGNRVNEHRDLVRRIHNEGHLVGNHSYWHKATFDLLPASKVEKELSDTNAAIKSSIGVTPKFFRPPYGVTNPMLATAVKRGGFTVVGWSVRSFDTMTEDRAKLFDRVTRSLKGGDVVLFHDFCDSTLDILPDFIKHVSDVGLKIVRVDKLLNEKAYA